MFSEVAMHLMFRIIFFEHYEINLVVLIISTAYLASSDMMEKTKLSKDSMHSAMKNVL